MWAMIVKEFRQVRRDHRTLAMMIVMPVVLLVVFGYAASFDTSSIPTVVGGPGAETVIDRLPDLFAVENVDPALNRPSATEMLRRGEAVVALIVGTDGGLALIDGSELFSARAAVQALTAGAPNVSVEVLFNPGLDTSVVLVPGLAGLILLFIGTVITSLGVVRERQSGTLEQLAVMPLRPRDVFVGKVAPYFLVACVDLVIVLVVGSLIFDVPFNGSLGTLALGAVLFLFVTLGVGVLISGVSENQGQAVQLALMTLLPQVLLSGIIFPLESMAAGVRWLGYLLPLTWFNLIARGVMVRGAPLGSVAVPLAILAGFGVVVFGLAVVRFRRDLASSHGEPIAVSA
ncbi:MAG TPA: ABC transporter permease [Acidimicrobiia bacterium]|nr:ABC transporter permease [Acidimicrobiia bacterium]